MSLSWKDFEGLGVLEYPESFQSFVIYVHLSIIQSNTSEGTTVKDFTDVIEVPNQLISS